MTEFRAKLDRWKKRFPDLAVAGMEQAATKNIIPRSQEHYLTGPRPDKLGVRSGILRRSITHKVDRPRVMVQIGTNVKYAAIHEYGGTIKHPGGTAYFVRDGKAVFISNAAAAGKNYPRTRAHSITMPARPFLRPAIKDERQRTMQVITETVTAGYDG